MLVFTLLNSLMSHSRGLNGRTRFCPHPPSPQWGPRRCMDAAICVGDRLIWRMEKTINWISVLKLWSENCLQSVTSWAASVTVLRSWSKVDASKPSSAALSSTEKTAGPAAGRAKRHLANICRELQKLAGMCPAPRSWRKECHHLTSLH